VPKRQKSPEFLTKHKRYGTRTFAEITGPGSEAGADLPVRGEDAQVLSLDTDGNAGDGYFAVDWAPVRYSLFPQYAFRHGGNMKFPACGSFPCDILKK